MRKNYRKFNGRKILNATSTVGLRQHRTSYPSYERQDDVRLLKKSMEYFHIQLSSYAAFRRRILHPISSPLSKVDRPCYPLA